MPLAQPETTLQIPDLPAALPVHLDILQTKEALTVPLALVVTTMLSATAIFVPLVATLYLVPTHVSPAPLVLCQPLEATAVTHLVELVITNKDKDASSRLTLLMIKMAEMALLITLMAPLLDLQESPLDSSMPSSPWSSFLLEVWPSYQSNISVLPRSPNREMKTLLTIHVCLTEASKWLVLVKEMKSFKHQPIQNPLNNIN